MKDYSITFINPHSFPEKLFMVCDLDSGLHFIDPLILMSHPKYDVYNENEDGIYAIGGKISPDLMEEGYKWGIFPWFPFKEEYIPLWFCPRKRYVIFPEKIHISHSMRNLINKNIYTITYNTNFEEVILNCCFAQDRYDNEKAWLGEDIVEAALELHKRGLAKSFEVWQEGKLVGGFYGTWYKGVFQGESMFSLSPSASNFALVSLCRNPYIEGEKIKFIDVQIENPNFKSLGAEYIDYADYRRIMDRELIPPVITGQFPDNVRPTED